MIRQLLFARTGSAGESIRRWWYQRLSAVALLPLSLWFIYDLSTLASLEYAVVRAWIAAPSSAILFILLIPTLFFHAQSGLQEVIEDYLANERHKTAAIILGRLLATLCALAAMLAVMKIHLGL